MKTYTIKTVSHAFMYTVASLTDELGVTQEFRGRSKWQALKQAFDHIGRGKARILTDDYSLVKARKFGEIPRNFEVRYEVGRR
ncbi:hypothetical protein LCL96_12440 [Rossellomorea aquimaris]|uniref:hypothetical protein n=1 Tax=Rossellomorea aquimaris TaxID=189382 RepID=UPI001CD591F7|nr:hypothetical protein [Rossellomorea aquimaris]MCA1059756.1 hypothetical protein [Rossellomorea aquimaris]